MHRAADRIVDILELVVGSREGFSLKDLSRQLRVPKSSLLPLLRTLSARGCLEQGPNGEYRVGQRVLEWGLGGLGRRELPEVALPVLVELMRRTGETVFLGQLARERDGVVLIEKVESDQRIRYSAGLGERRPLHGSGIGKVFLAFMPPEEREAVLRKIELRRLTDRTITSRAALRKALEQVRAQGVGVSIEESVPGAIGIAAPIFGRDGQVVAACTIGGPAARVRANMRRIQEEVKVAARTVSRLLGYRGENRAEDARRTARPASVRR